MLGIKKTVACKRSRKKQYKEKHEGKNNRTKICNSSIKEKVLPSEFSNRS